jgi:hypothetical protein
VDLGSAWRSVGVDFNRYLSALRKQFGKLSVVRCWESHLDGFPHVHALILFKDWSFKGFSHVNLKGKLSYRVYSVNSVKGCWDHGHSDVLAMSSTQAGFGYVGKYLRKSVQVSDDSKVVKTLALCWDFRKRAYSLSGDWRLQASDLIVPLTSNSNLDSGVPSFLSLPSERSEALSWSLFGLYKGDHVLLGSDGGDLGISAIRELLDSGLMQR